MESYCDRYHADNEKGKPHNHFVKPMESPKRPATYTEYPRKPATETEEATNWMSLASLLCGLISVLSSVRHDRRGVIS